MSKLTAKQQTFCDEYLVDLNATQAAIRAGYSVKTAKSIGQENLTKPDIAEYLEIRMQDRVERTEVTADMVLTEAWEGYKKLRDRDEMKDALGYLKVVGEHTNVKAFDKTVKVEDARFANFSDAELIARRDALQKRIDHERNYDDFYR